MLCERRVRPTARLQLRHLWPGAERSGTDAIEDAAIQRLQAAMNGRVHHQLLGHPQVVQDDPRQDGDVALFHLADDGALGFNFLDAGDLLWFGTPADIRARRWKRLTVWPSSC